MYIVENIFNNENLHDKMIVLSLAIDQLRNMGKCSLNLFLFFWHERSKSLELNLVA